LILSGCFEVIEEITLNDDGSGQIEVTLNISRSKTRLNSIMLLDSINSYKIPSKVEIEKNVDKVTAELRKIKGVSNVVKSINFDEFIFSIACDFTDIDVLNKVITHFGSDTHAKIKMDNQQFSYNKRSKEFKRNYQYDLSKEVKKINYEDRKVLDNASVTTIYRFESPIVSATNSHAKISGSRKAIMLKIDVQDMINSNKGIKNTIKLK
jgi:hypothetical protein